MASLPEPLNTLYFLFCVFPLLLLLLLPGLALLALLSPIILLRICAQRRPTALGSEERELAVAIDEGSGTGSKVLVFLHGWPDSAEVWRAQIDFFSAKGYRCIALELPNYGRCGERCSWGHDYDTLAVMVCNTLRRLKATSGGVPASLVCHDLGAWIGYIVEKSAPEVVGSLVSFDCSPAPDISPGVVLALLAYQLFNVLVFLLSLVPLLGSLPADFLFRAFVRIVLPPLAQWGRPGAQLSPTHAWCDLRASSCYGYWYMWKGCNMPKCKLFALAYKGWKSSPKSPAGELPGCPTLFLYGTSGLELRGRRWCEEVNRRGQQSGGHDPTRAIGLPCHHWLMTAMPSETNQLMEAFFRGLLPPEMRFKGLLPQK